LFESGFEKFRKAAQHKGRILAQRIGESPDMLSLVRERMEPFLKEVMKDEPAIQLIAVTGLDGRQIAQAQTQRGEKGLFRPLMKENFLDHEWFREVVASGQPYASDLFFSKFTGKLIMTFAVPVRNETGETVAILDVDFKFDELTQLISALPRDVVEDE
ncbi:MAG: PDC sensor domain-containing protein, partial [Lentisphaeria bacterium]|nr:PDC sensor domain-containing protein [Lentisphaeria bacterium]